MDYAYRHANKKSNNSSLKNSTGDPYIIEKLSVFFKLFNVIIRDKSINYSKVDRNKVGGISVNPRVK